MTKSHETASAEDQFAKVLDDYTCKLGTFNPDYVPQEEIDHQYYLIQKMRGLVARFNDPDDNFCGQTADDQIKFLQDEVDAFYAKYKDVDLKNI